MDAGQWAFHSISSFCFPTLLLFSGSLMDSTRWGAIFLPQRKKTKQLDQGEWCRGAPYVLKGRQQGRLQPEEFHICIDAHCRQVRHSGHPVNRTLELGALCCSACGGLQNCPQLGHLSQTNGRPTGETPYLSYFQGSMPNFQKR